MSDFSYAPILENCLQDGVFALSSTLGVTDKWEQTGHPLFKEGLVVMRPPTLGKWKMVFNIILHILLKSILIDSYIFNVDK